MEHRHEWGHLTTERDGNTRAVRHWCAGCPEIMVTTLRFKGGDVAGVEIGSERQHFCPASEHNALWLCVEPGCRAGREVLCAEHDNGAVREALGGAWVE